VKLKDFRSPVYLVMGCVLVLILGAGMSATPDIAFGIESGFYAEPVALEIISGMKCDIYYTTDGSVPDETDELYTGAITLTDATSRPNRLSAVTDICYGKIYMPTENVMKANVIRAVAITPWGAKSEVLSGTFFVGYDREEIFPNVPVISLMMEYDDLFDYETGIYVTGKTFDEWLAQRDEEFEFWQTKGNFSNEGARWERPVAVEYLACDDETGFNQDMGICIKGGGSRTYPQKSLRLIAREEYGKGTIEYPLFPGNERLDGEGCVQEYASVSLRNSSNDGDYTRIRDPLIQELAHGLRIATQATAPCVVFLNGEYWGQYTLTEDYGAEFIEANCGIDAENVISVKAREMEDGEEPDIDVYIKMADFVVKNDMAVEENYQRASAMLDMESLADYCAVQLYIANKDNLLEYKNWRMWSVQIPNADDSSYDDGKWRIMLYDTEYSSALYSNTEDYAYDNISPMLAEVTIEDVLKSGYEGLKKGSYNQYEPVNLVRALWRNQDFRRELSLCDVRNIYFEKGRVATEIAEMRGEYEPLLDEHFMRFGPSWAAVNVDGHIDYQFQILGDFYDKRYDGFLEIVRSALDLPAPVSVTVRTNDAQKGAVMLGHSTLDMSKDFTGLYFPECNVVAAAVPNEGAAFVRWEIEGGVIDDPAAQCIELPLESDIVLTAIFE
jgi:hypothetical protein